MSPGDIVSFLVPQLDDPLQLVFFSIIVFMMGLTIVSTHRHAQPAAWERKWNRGTPDDTKDDLDIEHGSVTDLWHAVATSPEKLAEIMPGLLLVVGLLGTFLGLGMALNHASSILGQADLADAGAAANSMQNLLGMLQGLGTKFKTSTWGILGFVLLKIWSEVTRFEEKRLTWVIGKVKAELEHRKRAKAAADQAGQDILFANIGRVATSIVDGMSTEFAALIKSDQQLHLQTLQHMNSLEQVSQGMRAELEQVRVESQATRVAMSDFTQGTQHVVESMGQAAQRMADGADKVGAGAEQLLDAIRTFERQFKDVLDNVRLDLGKAIHDMSAQARDTLERGSAQLGEATGKISTALGELSKDTKETMGEVRNSIGQSLDIQKTTSRKFIVTSDALTENIQATTSIVNSMADSIKEGLDSVASATLRTKNVATAATKSSESTERLVAQLESLPESLKPLKSLADEQKSLVAALAPVSGIAEVQRRMLDLLQAMQTERTAAAAAGAPTQPEPTPIV